MIDYLEKVFHVRYWHKSEHLMIENWLDPRKRKSQGKKKWSVWDKTELCRRIQAQRNSTKENTYKENKCDGKGS